MIDTTTSKAPVADHWGYTLRMGMLYFRTDWGFETEQSAMDAAKEYVGSARGITIETFFRQNTVDD